MKKAFIEMAWKVAGIHPVLSKIVSGAGWPRRNTYLTDTGWFNSFGKRIPIDSKGQPIPWYSYPAIAFLEQRATDSLNVFEFGCGNSTQWWSKKAEKVVSCEHDQEWFDRIVDTLPENAECRHVPKESYAHFITEFKEEFDVIVIDGIERVDCALNCLGALKKEGVVIWDNSDRIEYQQGYDYLLSQGFRQLDFSGLGPIVMISTKTTIFYRSGNCLGI